MSQKMHNHLGLGLGQVVSQDTLIYYKHLLEQAGYTVTPKPKPKTVKVDFWVNVYEDSSVSGSFDTKKEADCAGFGEPFACIHIQRDVVEGEGLE